MHGGLPINPGLADCFVVCRVSPNVGTALSVLSASSWPQSQEGTAHLAKRPPIVPLSVCLSICKHSWGTRFGLC